MSRVSLAIVVALMAGPAAAACPAWLDCRDGWLWEWLLPITVIGGLAVWVGGPLVLALVRGIRGLTGRPRAGG